ncbi:MAG: PD40 domain-containing protein [Anaerolineales bacterium]|nr:MAG: PD40 domain-containing protein [Anaerolineales bacterium]
MGPVGMEQRRPLAFALCSALLALLAACAPAPEGGNPVQTAIAATLTARPFSTPPTATQAPPTPTPTFEPGGRPRGKIVYVCQYSKQSGRNQICIMNADGSDPRTLTQGGQYDDFFPSITPDGQYVLFASNRTGRYQIYEYQLASDQLTQLTEFTNISAFAPTASPDGRWIVFYATRDGQTYPASHSIWVMARDGTGALQLTQRTGGGWDPVWSPDSTRIQFAGEVNGFPQLFVMNADGSQLSQVTRLSGLRGRNDWSVNGLLATYLGGSWDRDIYVFDTQGENVVQLTDGGNNLAPSFSPDGQWLTFMSYRDNPRQDLGCEIYVMRVDGTDARRLTSNDICDWQPRWGP